MVSSTAATEPDVATATPVAMCVGAVTVVTEAAPGVMPMRVTDDSRLGGTTGLLGGIGGGTPRPWGKVAGVFLIVDTNCGWPGLVASCGWICGGPVTIGAVTLESLRGPT